MPEVWYALAALALTTYVVLDGFDFGAGALHLVVAKIEKERRAVIDAVGPVWAANEVWLLATGGALFVAFPPVLASGLSGFYFAIFLVLWTSIVRAVAIDLRNHVDDPLWHSAWDVAFCSSSALLPFLWGTALGNLIRGLPIGPDRWFSLALFTDFTARPPVGILDWYTIAAGLFAWIALAGHGALYLAWKTTGPVRVRSRRAASLLYAGVTVLLIPLTIATSVVNASMLEALPHRPGAWLAIAVAVAGLAAVWIYTRRARALAAFLGSCAFLAGMLIATATCLFPVLLRSIDDDSRSLTAFNASVPEPAMRIGLQWWAFGLLLVIVYFVALFRFNRGPVASSNAG